MSIFYAVARLLTATPYILVNVLRVPLVSNTPNGFLLYNVAVINYSTYVLSKQPKGAPPTAKWQWVSAHNMRKEFIYEKIGNKELISETLLYNSICYFEIEPEEVIELLNSVPKAELRTLDRSFSDVRTRVRELLSNILSSHAFSEPFYDPEIEDIVFYQIAHGYPVG